jgi:hypothetical protein
MTGWDGMRLGEEEVWRGGVAIGRGGETYVQRMEPRSTRSITQTCSLELKRPRSKSGPPTPVMTITPQSKAATYSSPPPTHSKAALEGAPALAPAVGAAGGALTVLLLATSLVGTLPGGGSYECVVVASGVQ